MMRFYKLFFLLFVFSFAGAYAQKSMLSTTCDVLMAQDPITRTVGLGQENVVAGNFQALGQQYNGLTGAMKGVRFWGRTNPSAGVAANVVKVVLYNVNQGKPNQILTSTTVTLDSSSTFYEVNAMFTSPYTVSTPIIITVEPLFPSTDNYFIKTNAYGDGLNLNMSKIKQGGLWYLGASEGYDMDLYIFPIGTATVTANFTNTTSALTASFTNTSTSSSSYLWNFGDGTTSTASAPPAHTYALPGTYSVKLKSYHSDTTCADSITKSVTVIATGIAEKNQDIKTSLTILRNPVQNVLTISSVSDAEIEIYNIMGSLILKEKIKKDIQNEINVSELMPGVYFVRTESNKATKFLKVN